ncbi:hypothetical protein N7466_005289 [Penicillium verhagenii]|uniref:uncharacterized protein n=1 Tax=Penicillium verhagenii TaxID=1562060 RepID=UPI0025457A47|nr:uncharacterized protein N7466_005289 [Penicillium verhagenii]KAJ5935742.1 hypothetical protein N7466_005289 [Penicillium verhagenii]
MASNVSALHHKGQKLYQRGEFKAAVEAFGEALKQRDADAIGILDNRAATFCKLEDYDQARRDSRHMIKKASQDERGYLRCAKVLLLEGKPGKALEIYAYGLKTLPSKHPRRDLLQQLHNKLQDRMLLNKRDPFTMLPFEMAMMVIQDFSFKQIVGILRVCKGWQQFFGSISHLWMNIDFSMARANVSFSAVRSCIRRSKGMLTQATIKKLPLAQTPRTLEFLSRCPDLEHLELWISHPHKDFFGVFKGSKKLRSLVLSADMAIPHDYLGRFLIELPKLERVALWNTQNSSAEFLLAGSWPTSLPNLKSITLCTTQLPPSRPLTSMAPALHIPYIVSDMKPHPYQNLEELRLEANPPKVQPLTFPSKDDLGTDHRQNIGDLTLPPLRHLELRGIFPDTLLFAYLPTSLESLTISGGVARPNIVTPVPKTFSNLHTLICSDTGWLSALNLRTMLFELQLPVRKLCLDRCFGLAWLDFTEIVAERANNTALVNLQEFSLTHTQSLDDTYANVLVHAFPNLTLLDLSYTSITGCTIRMIAESRVSGSVKIDCLILRGCEGISSDAVLYGREQGLDVVV